MIPFSDFRIISSVLALCVHNFSVLCGRDQPSTGNSLSARGGCQNGVFPISIRPHPWVFSGRVFPSLGQQALPRLAVIFFIRRQWHHFHVFQLFCSPFSVVQFFIFSFLRFFMFFHYCFFNTVFSRDAIEEQSGRRERKNDEAKGKGPQKYIHYLMFFPFSCGDFRKNSSLMWTKLRPTFRLIQF